MKEFLKRKSIFGLFLGYCVLIQFLMLGSPENALIVEWPAHELTANYSYGFIRRGLMGTVVQLVSQALRADTLEIIFLTQFMGTIVFVALLIFFFFLILKKTNTAASKMMILLFVAMGGIGFYFFRWGEMDIFMISISLVSCILIIKSKYIWLIPFFSAVCVMIHEGYVMMYFGIIMALLLYRATMEEDKDNKKKFWICLFSTGILTTALFIYFYFFSVSVSKVHIDEILANAEQNLRILLQEVNMRYIYAGDGLPSAAMWVKGKPTDEFFIRMVILCLNILVCLPIIILLIRFWNNVLRHTIDRRRKVITIVCLAFQLLTIPLVLVQTDQARWFYAVVYFNFLFTSSVMCIGNKEISLAASKFFTPSIGKWILFVFYFLFFMSPHLQSISSYYIPPAKEIMFYVIGILT